MQAVIPHCRERLAALIERNPAIAKSVKLNKSLKIKRLEFKFVELNPLESSLIFLVESRSKRNKLCPYLVAPTLFRALSGRRVG